MRPINRAPDKDGKRECRICGKTLPATRKHFYYSVYKKKHTGEVVYGLTRKCKRCTYDLLADRRKTDEGKSVVARSSRVKRLRKKAFCDKIKVSLGCADCGYNDHPAALDFDHLEGAQKKFSVSAVTAVGWKSLLEELHKCEVVCANCHRVRTAKRHEAKSKGLKADIIERRRNIAFDDPSSVTLDV